MRAPIRTARQFLLRIFCLHWSKNISTSCSVRRERRKTGKDKKLDGAVRSAKERAKAWSDAAIATQTALEALRKLVAEATTEPKPDPKAKSRQ